MIFWIIAGVILAASIVVAVIATQEEDGISGFWAFLGVNLCGGAILAIYSLIIFAAAQGEKFVLEEKTYTLKELKLSTGVDGEYYLSTDAAERDVNFTYINKDGSLKLDQVSHDNAKIFEDASEKPTVTRYRWESNNPIWVPWGFGRGYTYEFHVIVEHYSLNQE